MATYVRALVETYRDTDLPKDRVSNTVHFKRIDAFVLQPIDWQNLSNDIADVFAGFRPLSHGMNRVTTKLYSLEDAEPRPVKATTTRQPTPAVSAGGPREVALCLSYYAERNIPRNRGRLYLGPWNGPAERPSSTIISACDTLRQLLANIGGIDVKWCVYSPTTFGGLDAKFKQVTGGWIDDEWDTVRKRGLKATQRNAWTMEG